VLIFTSSVKHCQHVAEAIRGYSGQECAIVTGETPAGERAEVLDRFKGKAVPADLFGNTKPPLKFLCNVNVLTTGFDAVNTDCVVLLRPTNSPGLLVQMVGRGTRLSPETGKTDCLVLDYGGNIMRHGPVDMIRVKDKTPGNGDAPAKKCPQCYALIHAAYAKCPQCGYEFPPSNHTELTQHAAHDGIISGEVFMDEYDVRKTYYDVHRKRNALDDDPSTMRIDYEVAFQTYKSEWVCPEHTGYARTKFIKWWKARAPEWLPVPQSASEAVRLARAGYLAEAKKITVRSTAGEKFETITKYELGPRPQREPGDDTAEVGVSGDLHVEDFDPDEIPF
jgi:DNA repair protein RadD